MGIITVRQISIIVFLVALGIQVDWCGAVENRSYLSQKPHNIFIKTHDDHDDDDDSKETDAEPSVPSEPSTPNDSTTTPPPPSTTTTASTPNVTTPPPPTTTTVTPPEPHTNMCQHLTTGNLHFPETAPGQWATPKELCLNDDYTPVRIQCVDGTWIFTEPVTCSNLTYKESTAELYKVLNENPLNALNAAIEVVKKHTSDLEVIDIHLVSKILDRASRSDIIAENYTGNFFGVVNNIMNVTKGKLDSSQKLLNSTDNILYSLDQFVFKSSNANLTKEKLLIRTIPVSGTIIGAMITSGGNTDNFNSFQLDYLDKENYLDKINNTDFEIAFVVPPTFTNGDHYYITLFYNDVLFSQANTTLGSWIISILVPDSIKDSGSTIEIYYKQLGNNFQQECQHWRYGMENNVAINGGWSLDSNATKLKDGFYKCTIDHTTHFGMLVSGTVADSYVLDLITIFGSALSVIGICIIFLTALIFKQWRNKANSKIILNVSFCLLILIILFIISDKVERGPGCITVGMMLHYTIIAQFCWALTVSYSSYRRFHMVSHDHIKHVVLKFCAFSWGVPLIIVIIVAAINIQTYDKLSDKNSSQICYPKEMYLQLGVFLPMGIILATNCVVYILITKNLLTTKLDIRKHVSKKSFSVHKSMVLLFFMMGITWIFGFLVAFTDNTVFLYLFCTTATLHGFAIFLFYVIDSTEVKQLWKDLFKRKAQKQKIQLQSTEVTNETGTH